MKTELNYNTKKDAERRGSPASVEDVALRNLRLNVLEICNGNRCQAAAILGVDIRCFRQQLTRYAAEGYTIPPTHVRNRSVTLGQGFWDKLSTWMSARFK